MGGGPPHHLPGVAQLLDGFFESGLNAELADQIAAARLLVAARVYPGTPSEEQPSDMVQLLHAAIQDATPVFEGTDVVALASDAVTDVGLCGWIDEQRFGSPYDPTFLRFPVTWMGTGGSVWLDLHLATLEGDLSGDTFTDMRIGGGIDQQQIRYVLIPQLAEQLTTALRAPPSSEIDMAASLFDHQCSTLSDVPGCEDVVNGQGDCDGQADPPVITETELWCNQILQAVIAPDIDSDGDGEPDLLSFGAKLSAAPATLVEP